MDEMERWQRAYGAVSTLVTHCRGSPISRREVVRREGESFRNRTDFDRQLHSNISRARTSAQSESSFEPNLLPQGTLLMASQDTHNISNILSHDSSLRRHSQFCSSSLTQSLAVPRHLTLPLPESTQSGSSRHHESSSRNTRTERYASNSRSHHVVPQQLLGRSPVHLHHPDPWHYRSPTRVRSRTDRHSADDLFIQTRADGFRMINTSLQSGVRATSLNQVIPSTTCNAAERSCPSSSRPERSNPSPPRRHPDPAQYIPLCCGNEQCRVTSPSLASRFSTVVSHSFHTERNDLTFPSESRNSHSMPEHSYAFSSQVVSSNPNRLHVPRVDAQHARSSSTYHSGIERSYSASPSLMFDQRVRRSERTRTHPSATSRRRDTDIVQQHQGVFVRPEFEEPLQTMVQTQTITHHALDSTVTPLGRGSRVSFPGRSDDVRRQRSGRLTEENEYIGSSVLSQQEGDARAQDSGFRSNASVQEDVHHEVIQERIRTEIGAETRTETRTGVGAGVTETSHRSATNNISQLNYSELIVLFSQLVENFYSETFLWLYTNTLIHPNSRELRERLSLLATRVGCSLEQTATSVLSGYMSGYRHCREALVRDVETALRHLAQLSHNRQSTEDLFERSSTDQGNITDQTSTSDQRSTTDQTSTTDQRSNTEGSQQSSSDYENILNSTLSFTDSSPSEDHYTGGLIAAPGASLEDGLHGYMTRTQLQGHGNTPQASMTSESRLAARLQQLSVELGLVLNPRQMMMTYAGVVRSLTSWESEARWNLNASNNLAGTTAMINGRDDRFSSTESINQSWTSIPPPPPPYPGFLLHFLAVLEDNHAAMLSARGSIDLSYEALMELSEQLGEVKQRGLSPDHLQALHSYTYTRSCATTEQQRQHNKTTCVLKECHGATDVQQEYNGVTDVQLENETVESRNTGKDSVSDYSFISTFSVSLDKSTVLRYDAGSSGLSLRASTSSCEQSVLPSEVTRCRVSDPLCVVCLEEFETGDDVNVLPCKHEYHSGCVITWLQINGTCPVCRDQVAVRLDAMKIC